MTALSDKSNIIPARGRRKPRQSSNGGQENASSSPRRDSSKSTFVNESVLTIDSTADSGNVNLTRINVSDSGVLSINGVGAITASPPNNVYALVPS